MNGYRMFIVFSIGYAGGTLAQMAVKGNVSRISSGITLVLLSIAGIMYVMKKDLDVDEKILTAFQKGIDVERNSKKEKP